MSFNWFRGAASKLLSPAEDIASERQYAARARASAEESLRVEVENTAEVGRVAAIARNLRRENNFSRRITESFRGHNGKTAG